MFTFSPSCWVLCLAAGDSGAVHWSAVHSHSSASQGLHTPLHRIHQPHIVSTYPPLSCWSSLCKYSLYNFGYSLHNFGYSLCIFGYCWYIFGYFGYSLHNCGYSLQIFGYSLYDFGYSLHIFGYSLYNFGYHFVLASFQTFPAPSF